jgi:hypothetical protein
MAGKDKHFPQKHKRMEMKERGEEKWVPHKILEFHSVAL